MKQPFTGKTLPFNNQWLYKQSFEPSNLSTLEQIDGYTEVRLPHTNIELPYNYFDENDYQFQSVYKKKLPPMNLAADEEAILHFEGVMASCVVYLNGEIVGNHEGGYTPFEVDVTSGLTGNDWLLVHVDSSEQQNIPPFGFVIDYLTYGGIYREVQLIVRHKWHITSVKVDTPMIGDGVFEALVALEHTGQDLTASFTLKDDGRVLLQETVSGTGSFIKTVLKPGNSITPWDLTHPKLYTLEVLLESGEKSCDEMAHDEKISEGESCDEKSSGKKSWDEMTHNEKISEGEFCDEKSSGKKSCDEKTHDEKFSEVKSCDEKTYDKKVLLVGFRTVSFTTEGFFLNGQAVKLRGLNRHQSYPYVGYAMPKRAQYDDADILKNELGVTIVRSSHYPPSRHFLDRCDQIGLLVFNEIPGWQHIGDDAWQEKAIVHVKEMIRRDWNHPSVVIWGVRINESPDNDSFYERTNQTAKELDQSRPTGGVRNFSGSHLLEDVYTYNDFVHRGNNRALENVKKITGKSVPYLVTEHNGHMFPTKSFDSEAKRIEHALRHARVLDEAYGSAATSGAIGWCMADYNTHKDFGSGDKICYHGVLDMFRLPKYAASLYASQSDDKPRMVVASNLFVGDFDASELGHPTIFTNCEEVEVYKNDVLINRFIPDRSQFKHLPHPPVVVNDLIGNLIKEQERFSPKDADAIKKLLLLYVSSGSHLPIYDQIKMWLLFIKYKMNLAEGARLYGKYIASWGEKSTVYRFEGKIAGKTCCIEVKDTTSKPQLNVHADHNRLTDADTYDVTRFTVTLSDANGQPLHYANHVIRADIEGPLEIIGPKSFALIGGQRAFWVKTMGQCGTATVIVSSEELTEMKTITIQIDAS